MLGPKNGTYLVQTTRYIPLKNKVYFFLGVDIFRRCAGPLFFFCDSLAASRNSPQIYCSISVTFLGLFNEPFYTKFCKFSTAPSTNAPDSREYEQEFFSPLSHSSLYHTASSSIRSEDIRSISRTRNRKRKQ